MSRLSLSVLPLLVALAAAQSAQQPQQIHLSLGQQLGSQRWVSFVTLAPLHSSSVVYQPAKAAGPASAAAAASCTQRNFTDGGSQHRTIVMHECLMDQLSANTAYTYQVGDVAAGIMSAVYNFSTWTDPYPQLDIAFFGDMGVENDRSQPVLIKDLHNGGFDMIIHVGDFAYDMDDNQGELGDQFMNEIQPLAAYVPYMTCLGNHETAYNFSHYTQRFSAVGAENNGNNWWYSFDVSYVHFVALSSELYYNDYLYPKIFEQLKWLEADLQQVNRSATPFVIAFFHRPLYCSNTDDLPDCTTDAQRLREGFSEAGVNFPGLENVLATYHTNLILAAHEHSYERTTPVVNGTVQPGLVNPGLYLNPTAPVYIVSGAGGCHEDLDYYDELHHANWSYLRSASYGYNKMRIINSTHLHFDQLLSEGTNGTDQFFYVQTQVPASPRTDLPLNTYVHKCGDYCLAVCMHSGERSAAECATNCRCEAELAAGHLDAVISRANLRTVKGLVHRR